MRGLNFQGAISILRRGTNLLPFPLRLRALSWIDVTFKVAEIENICIPKLAAESSKKHVAVDVGANNGVTSSIMALSFSVVHAFEPNPRLAVALKKCAPVNVRVHALALSSKSGDTLLQVPTSKGVVLEGWGSVESLDHPDFDGSKKFPVKTETLDNFELADVGLIKIDVEGHELSVLEGAVETIERCRPWLVIEAKGEHQPLVRNFMQKRGYIERSLESLANSKGGGDNLIFLPFAI